LKDIKPYQVTLYVLGILLLLTPIVYFIPEDGWKIAGNPIKFLSQEQFYHPQKQEKTDITDVLLGVDTTMMDMNEDPLLKHNGNSNGNLGAPNGGPLNENSSTELQMNESGRANLHAFFEILDQVAESKKKISILHYGDSQIEGDRMTGYIRQKIQNQFGGNGPGLIPATNVYSTMTFKQTYSANFQRYIAFGKEKLKNSKYGAMASASRFTPDYKLDTIGKLDSLPERTGWIEISPNAGAYERAKSYNNVKMHYNSCIAPTLLKVYQDGNLIHEEQLITDGGQHTVKLSFANTPKLKFEFKGKVSPNICGFSLEGDYGVQVSNIGMRGSSGTIFRAMNQTVMKKMYDELNTKLIIMQFGGNSVPFFTDSASVRNFASFFKSQINTLKNLNPGAMIIVIGPSDMSGLKDGIYSTYKYLPYCVEQMMEATKSTGSAYWNLYAGMGGYNSMPSWVEKGLAGKDYIHFSNGGAKIASQMFYDAFIAEFAKWKNNK